MTGDVVVSVARVALAAVFLVSGTAKVVDRRGFARAIASYHLVSPRLVSPLTLLFPLLEVVAAVGLLLWGNIAVAATAGAALLIAAFSAVQIAALRRGRVADCHCFGTLRPEPIGPKTLTRNGVLFAMALLALITGPGPDFPARVGEWLELSRAAVIVIAAIGLLVAGEGIVLATWSARFNQQTASAPVPAETAIARPAPVSRPVGLGIGDPAPVFALPDLDGVERTLDDLVAASAAARRDLLVVFSDPACGVCDEVLAELAALQRSRPEVFDLVLVTTGTAAENWLKTVTLGLAGPVLRQREFEVLRAYGLSSTPAGVVLDDTGAIIAGPAEGAEAVLDLVAPFAGNHAGAGGIVAGSPIPPVHLLDDLGMPIPLDNLVDRPVLLLFFDAGCGYCTAMLPGLRARQPAWRAHDLRVAIVTAPDHALSLGDVTDVAIYREINHHVSDAFDVGGTPSGVLIDRDGRLASRVAVGEDAIWQLVDRWAGKHAAAFAMSQRLMTGGTHS